MENVEQTIISQYGNSATITRLIQNMNVYIDPTKNINDFFDWIFNIETARGFGLDYIGRIVGVSRTVFSGTPYEIDDEAYRALIEVKMLANISAATAPAINQLLRNWLGADARAYVSKVGTMMIRYTFEFRLQPFQILIITKAGVFLRPSGVDVTLQQSSLPVFGFSEAGPRSAAPFGQAPFIAEDATDVVS